ncbi:hypothetical protein [Cellulosilyticum sp. I15G10I2]|uniref:hypothetical protein n=1 Tax=Cellulosilyticum sp. I15G10I2 TaxID=1892843 RepID=UPI00085CC84C|nr:hypothetical protein [Cellulosilyticum sp. I15G10I2]
MKMKVLILAAALTASILAGCTPKAEAEPKPTETPTQEETNKDTTLTEEKSTQDKEQKVDAVTTASIVDSEDAFEKAIGKDGTWIICALKDLTFEKDLVLEGEFKNGKKNDDGTDAIQRKIALYTQDDDRKVTNRFTLTAPKLTIKSPNARIQSGTFKGELYVETNDFQLVDAVVEGNIYFNSEDAKAGFKMDEKSSITGKQEVR